MPFSRHNAFENQKYTEWPPELPEAFNYTSILCTLNTHPRAANFIRLRSLVFQIVEVFGCPIGYHYGEFQKFVKNQKLKFQNPKQYFCEDYFEENSGEVRKFFKVIWGRNSVLKKKTQKNTQTNKQKQTKKIVKNLKLKISKIPNSTLWGPSGRKFRKSLQTFGSNL